MYNPAIITAKADNKSRKYGFQNPAFTISYSGFKYTDNVSVISPALTASTVATFSSPPGTYPITISSSGTASNYIIQRVNGILTVEAAPSCTIIAPCSLPICTSTGNTLTAIAPYGYSYSWTVSGTGWQITSGNGTHCIKYKAGVNGSTGIFVLTVYAPVTNFAVCTCTISLGTICGTEYCTYGQGFWGSYGKDCQGRYTTSIVPTLLTTPLVNGYNTRKITIGTTEANCLICKLPAGSTTAQLPVGTKSCATATGSQYLSNGKFKNNLLGQEMALALSVRLQPALGTLKLTGSYLTTYAASACVNGIPVQGTNHTYSLKSSVVNYLGANNTVNDLVILANKGLGGALPTGAPSLSDISSTISTLLSAFDRCRILTGISQTCPKSMVLENDSASSISNELYIYPNPTSGNATASFLATQGSHAAIDIYNISGEVVLKVLDGTITEDGVISVEMNCSSFSKGFYLVRLSLDEETFVSKLVIIK